jgi:succinylglutamate desuccinylase
MNKVNEIDNCVWQIHSDKPGPKVLIFGGIHGDEPCGAKAIAKLIEAFNTGSLTLKCGSLTLAYGNAKSLNEGKRYETHNLNRLFGVSRTDSSYESMRVSILEKLILDSEYFLDIHSCSAPTPPFAMCEQETLEFTKSVGPQNIVLGWSELEGDAAAMQGTTEGFGLQHGVQCFTFEAGLHIDPKAIDISYGMVMAFCKSVGIFSAEDPQPQDCAIYKLTGVTTKRYDDFTFLDQFASFSTIQKGTSIYKENGKVVKAKESFCMFMPTYSANLPLGTEMFFEMERVN